MWVFALMLILIVGLQFILELFLSKTGLGYWAVEIIIDIVMAFIFALLNYPGRKKSAFKDVRFHRSVAVYFVIFIVIAVIMYFFRMG